MFARRHESYRQCVRDEVGCLLQHRGVNIGTSLTGGELSTVWYSFKRRDSWFRSLLRSGTGPDTMGIYALA